MVKRVLLTAATVLLVSTAMHTGAQAGDPEAGAAVFKKCQACHMVGEKAKNRVGPTLNGVVGRAWGAVEGYRYSEGRDGTLLQIQEAEQRVWDVATLHAYLTKPKDVIPKGKMAFAGLPKEADRDDVIAYMASFDEAGAAVDPAPVLEAAAGQ